MTWQWTIFDVFEMFLVCKCYFGLKKHIFCPRAWIECGMFCWWNNSLFWIWWIISSDDTQTTSHLGSRYDESPGCFEHEMSENNRSSIEMRSNYPKWCKVHTLIGKTHTYQVVYLQTSQVLNCTPVCYCCLTLYLGTTDRRSLKNPNSPLELMVGDPCQWNRL